MTRSGEVEEARARWIAERPAYIEFGEELKKVLNLLVRQLGMYADISCRAKEVHSLVKKLLAKPEHNYASLPDKVGARVVVRYRSELPRILDSVMRLFSCEGADNKSIGLGINRLGYQSIHVDGLHFREDAELATKFPAGQFVAELQIRTLAQHLWAEVSHDTIYKNDYLIAALPEDLQRRVNLMAGLVEVADREFDAMNSELPARPEVVLLKELEKFYYQLTAQRPNVELSLNVIQLLMPLYRGESESEIMQSHIAPTFAKSEGLLRHIYSNPDGDYDNASAFLFQPEVLLIYDCLRRDPDATLAAWNNMFPARELERIATVFGLAVE